MSMVGRLTIPLSAGGSVVALLVFWEYLQKPLLVAKHWEPVFYALLTLSFILSILQIVVRQGGSLSTYLLIFRLAIVTLIGYPLGGNLEIELVLGATLMVEAAVIPTFPYSVAFVVLFAALLISFHQPIIAWGIVVAGPSAPDLAVFAFQLLLVGAVAIFVGFFRKRYVAEVELNCRSSSAISQIVEANIGFQEYANAINEQSAATERKRISREMHDTIGYTLTNIIMLSQQALYATESEKDRLRNLLTTLNLQAREGLKDIRSALRELRLVETETLPGLKVVSKITNIFAAATGITVDFQTGNAPWDFGESTNAFVYRMIQEGLTNSYRHGKATKVSVHMWVESDTLNIIIHDNGAGAAEVVPGIGLSGMKERVEQLHGNLSHRSLPGGFELTAKVPLEKRL
jgi:signal transduction histidine kinase